MDFTNRGVSNFIATYGIIVGIGFVVFMAGIAVVTTQPKNFDHLAACNGDSLSIGKYVGSAGTTWQVTDYDFLDYSYTADKIMMTLEEVAE